MSRDLGVVRQQKYPQAHGEDAFQHFDSITHDMTAWVIDALCSSQGDRPGTVECMRR